MELESGSQLASAADQSEQKVALPVRRPLYSTLGEKRTLEISPDVYYEIRLTSSLAPPRDFLECLTLYILQWFGQGAHTSLAAKFLSLARDTHASNSFQLEISSTLPRE